MAKLKLLTFSTLYPNKRAPSHGVFVENRIAQLVASNQVETIVVAPVAYVPDTRFLPAKYRGIGKVSRREQRRGLAVHHPRYLLLPKISMVAAPLSLYLSARACIAKIIADGYDFDVIDAHYFYPDGVAAALLARYFDKPLTITARGSDITQLPDYALPRRMIQWAAGLADGMITVCAALKDGLVDLGADAGKIRVLRNGVDLVKFAPVDRDQARISLNLTGTMLLSVGHLIPRKGHDLAIEALVELPDVTLLIVGDGPERENLRAQTVQLGVADRVRFVGSVPHESLPTYYTAADALLLLSSREGWANVLLEAMACGTPVVATMVGGTPEVVTIPEVGELVPMREAASIAASIARLLARHPDRQRIRAYAEEFSWDATTQGQIDLFDSILRARDTPQPHVTTAPTIS